MKFKSIAQFSMFKNVSLGLRKVTGLTRNQATKDIAGKTPQSKGIKGLPKKVKVLKKK